MRKLIFIGLILFLPTLSMSQLSVGVRFGMGNHGINLEPTLLEQDQVPLFRQSYGIVAIFNNTNNSGLQMEINFAQKGWLEKIDSTESFFKRELNYIEIPAYTHFEIGRKFIRPIIIAGPYIGVRIKDKFTHNGFEHKIVREKYNHYIQNSRKIDLGIKAGLGLRVNIGKHLGVFGEVHYDLEIFGGRDVFINNPHNIGASRLTEISGVLGIIWHIVQQKEKKIEEVYEPKEILREYDF